MDSITLTSMRHQNGEIEAPPHHLLHTFDPWRVANALDFLKNHLSLCPDVQTAHNFSEHWRWELKHQADQV
jgi:tRNA A37 N6-isopentenylltransferase MiaA